MEKKIISLSEEVQEENDYFLKFKEDAKRRKMFFAGFIFLLGFVVFGMWQMTQVIPIFIRTIFGV